MESHPSEVVDVMRPVLAAALLTFTVVAGFVWGALSTVCADTGPDW